MKEIELKILEINPEQIKQTLIEFGAQKVFEGPIHAFHFDFPDQQLKKAGNSLRVRQKGNLVELTHKGKDFSQDFKIREETEVTTSDFSTTISILEKVGLQKTYELKKRRESYQIGEIHFDLDFPHLQFIPPLMEIEAPSEEEVKEWVHKIGFAMEQTSTMSAREVEEYYRRKNEQKN